MPRLPPEPSKCRSWDWLRGNANGNFGQISVFNGASFTGQSVIDTSALNGTNGFNILGPHVPSGQFARFGATLAVGDVNNDGIQDLLIGAPGLKHDGADTLINLLTADHSEVGDKGKHCVLVEPYGYRWYRAGGLDYLLKRTEF